MAVPSAHFLFVCHLHMPASLHIASTWVMNINRALCTMAQVIVEAAQHLVYAMRHLGGVSFVPTVEGNNKVSLVWGVSCNFPIVMARVSQHFF